MTDRLLQRRGAGVLLPLFSLPGLYGIGTMGAAAYRFVDDLSSAGQRYWQLLPGRAGEFTVPKPRQLCRRCGVY